MSPDKLLCAPHSIFEDFTQPELKEIWLEMSHKNSWRLDPNVAEVASRRV